VPRLASSRANLVKAVTRVFRFLQPFGFEAGGQLAVRHKQQCSFGFVVDVGGGKISLAKSELAADVFQQFGNILLLFDR
jgi:hypothetical protein